MRALGLKELLEVRLAQEWRVGWEDEEPGVRLLQGGEDAGDGF
jgi:hypothetical protein